MASWCEIHSTLQILMCSLCLSHSRISTLGSRRHKLESTEVLNDMPVLGWMNGWMVGMSSRALYSLSSCSFFFPAATTTILALKDVFREQELLRPGSRGDNFDTGRSEIHIL